jgi:hypothetical protein
MPSARCASRSARPSHPISPLTQKLSRIHLGNFNTLKQSPQSTLLGLQRQRLRSRTLKPPNTLSDSRKALISMMQRPLNPLRKPTLRARQTFTNLDHLTRKHAPALGGRVRSLVRDPPKELHKTRDKPSQLLLLRLRFQHL